MLHLNETIQNEIPMDYFSDDYDRSFQHLINLNARRGYVTDKDVLKLFPETDQDINMVNEVSRFLQNEGVLFIEQQEIASDTKDESPRERIFSQDNRAGHSEEDLMTNIDPGDLIGIYFHEAARRPLLTMDEEVALAKRIECGYHAREEILNIKDISTRKYHELLNQIEDSQAAVNNLITANSRLVISIAKKHTNRGVPLLDLIQEGNIGLMRAAKKFDYKRGFKFSTYATWWIRQAVTRAVADQSRTIRLPVHISDQLTKIFRTQHKLRQKLGRDPEITELTEQIGVNPEKIREMLKIAQFPLSLDMPTQVDSDNVLGDFVEDQDSPNPDEAATINLLRKHLEQLLMLLPAREVLVLKLRFGLSGEEPHSLQEIGRKIGVSRERIRQIEAQAISRLRHPEIQKQLRSYLEQRQT